MKHKISGNKAETAVIQEAAVTSSEADTENSTFESLSASLAEIRKLKGVIGYILRSNTSAIVDLAESDKLSEYAMFSSQILEFSSQVSEDFSLGSTESVLLEGATVKALCLKVDENKVGVFMEKTASHAWITKRILL